MTPEHEERIKAHLALCDGAGRAGNDHGAFLWRQTAEAIRALVAELHALERTA